MKLFVVIVFLITYVLLVAKKGHPFLILGSAIGIFLISRVITPMQAIASINYNVLGVFLGSASWWFILSCVSNVLRARFLKPAGLRWVNWISGTVITSFGIVALVSVLFI